MSNIEN